MDLFSIQYDGPVPPTIESRTQLDEHVKSQMHAGLQQYGLDRRV
jgi:hypothetical protein